MIKEKKINILSEILGSPFYQGKETLFHCPYCQHHNKKLSCDVDRNVYKCWICDKRGKSIFWLIKRFGNQSQQMQWVEIDDKIDFSTINENNVKEEKINLPKEFISIATHKPTPLMRKPLMYLKERGLEYKDIVWWKMGFCLEGKYKERIIIPSFDENGYVNYFVSRSYTNHPIPYLNPHYSKDTIFNKLYLDFSKDICIVEGVFDAIVVGNAIPLNGSLLSESSIIFNEIASKCQKVWLALDPDAHEKEKKIMKLFMMYGIDVYKVVVKPYKDVGCMNKEEFIKRKNNAILITNDNEIEYSLNE